MNLNATRNRTRAWLALAVSALWIFSSGCSSAAFPSSGGSNGGENPPTGANVQAISVNIGPTAAAGDGSFIDGAFTSVTVCVPGSTTQCQTINGILVDTGSFGLRILSSALTVSLPQQVDASNNPVAECAPFASGVIWGPVQTADFTIAGEKAASLPIQVIGSPSFSTIPTVCSSEGTPVEDLASLGANGILGVGAFSQDCGTTCAISGPSNPGIYYTCPASGCVQTTEAISSQVVNPVTLFATDNNGVIVELPSLSGTATNLDGFLIFGIGTESNNGVGSATVFGIDSSTGNFTTTFSGVAYPEAFIDSGSNAIYFLDPTTTGLPACTDFTFWYCPTAATNLSATNQGTNGSSGQINFSVGNADSLVSDPSIGAANGLAGPFPNVFDWGLPFFFRRNVYVAIDGQPTSAGPGPYWAY